MTLRGSHIFFIWDSLLLIKKLLLIAHFYSRHIKSLHLSVCHEEAFFFFPRKISHCWLGMASFLRVKGEVFRGVYKTCTLFPVLPLSESKCTLLLCYFIPYFPPITSSTPRHRLPRSSLNIVDRFLHWSLYLDSTAWVLFHQTQAVFPSLVLVRCVLSCMTYPDHLISPSYYVWL